MDALIIMFIGIAASFASLYGARCIPPAIITNSAHNTWFEADVQRVYSDMSFRIINHSRSNVHPLFVLATWPIVNLLRSTFGIGSLAAVRIVVAQAAALWIIVLFVLLRLMGCRRFDAWLFSTLAAISASAMFWFVIPETFPFGSLTILFALGVAALSQHKQLSGLWYVVGSAATLSITVTNWMVGIIVTFINRHWRSAAQTTVNAFCLVVVLWSLQKYFFPTGNFFLEHHDETRFMVSPETGGPLKVLGSFLFHSMVMPAFEEVDRLIRPGRLMMITQQSMPGSATAWGAVAVVLWTALLALGVWGLFVGALNIRLKTILALTLLGQLCLHLLYGWETFLYSAHFGPLLVVLAALGTFTRARQAALALAVALVVCAGINNVTQFNHAVKFYERHDGQLQNNSTLNR